MIEVVVGDLLARDGHLEPAPAVLVLDERDQTPNLSVGVRRDRDRHQQRVAVGRDERAIVRPVVDVGAGDRVRGERPAAERRDLGLELLVVDGRTARSDDDELAEAAARVWQATIEEALGSERLRIVRDLALARQVAGQQQRRRSESEDDRADPRRDRPPGMPCAETGDSLGHVAAFLAARRAARHGPVEALLQASAGPPIAALTSCSRRFRSRPSGSRWTCDRKTRCCSGMRRSPAAPGRSGRSCTGRRSR